jgi:hypothetical protein
MYKCSSLKETHIWDSIQLKSSNNIGWDYLDRHVN